MIRISKNVFRHRHRFGRNSSLHSLAYLLPKISAPHFFSTEIEYFLQVPAKSAERFAARFAAREALFKALHQALPSFQIPFLMFCSAIEITILKNGARQIILHWEKLNIEPQNIHILISWTHTKEIATAIATIQQI